MAEGRGREPAGSAEVGAASGRRRGRRSRFSAPLSVLPLVCPAFRVVFEGAAVRFVPRARCAHRPPGAHGVLWGAPGRARRPCPRVLLSHAPPPTGPHGARFRPQPHQASLLPALPGLGRIFTENVENRRFTDFGRGEQWAALLLATHSELMHVKELGGPGRRRPAASITVGALGVHAQPKHQLRRPRPVPGPRGRCDPPGQ